MARSLRSKWRRAMNREKRERYSKKELVKLKTMVENREIREQLVNEVQQIPIKKEQGDDSKPIVVPVPKEVQHLTSEYNPLTLRNKHGNYPKWLHKRQIRKLNYKKRINKKKNLRRLKKK